MSKNSNKSEKAPFWDFAHRFNLAFQGKPNAFDIAEAIGVHPETVYTWIRGAHIPNGKHLRSLRRVYGISIDWLLTGDDPIQSEAARKTALRQSIFERLLELALLVNEAPHESLIPPLEGMLASYEYMSLRKLTKPRV